MTWELNLGDCIEGMRGLPDKSVDHVIADPPYEAEAHTKARRQRSAGVVVELPISFAPLTREERMSYARQYARLARRWVLVFCQAEAITPWREAIECAGLRWVRAMVWVKPDSCPQFTGDRPAQGYESIAVAHAADTRLRWNAGGKRGVYTFDIGTHGGTRNLHPTQKPLSLMRSLVADFTDPGELILDSHAGSGTTGAACLELGRRFLGWELDPKHHATASKRLAEASKQQPLFKVATTQEQERLPL